MKRSLILALVVLAVTMANAAIVRLGVNGGPNPGELAGIGPSDTLELSVYAEPGWILDDFLISVSSVSGSLDASGVELTTQYMVSGTWPYTYEPWDIEFLTPVPGFSDDAQHFSFGGGNLPPTVTAFDEILMDGLIYRCDDILFHFIRLEQHMGGGVFELRDQLIILGIPEPATLSLMCLGGLLLRRRKK